MNLGTSIPTLYHQVTPTACSSEILCDGLVLEQTAGMSGGREGSPWDRAHLGAVPGTEFTPRGDVLHVWGPRDGTEAMLFSSCPSL